MGLLKLRKVWFLVKVFILVGFVTLSFFIVFQKDYIVQEFCDCPPCQYQDNSGNFIDNLVDAYCLCPRCD